MTCLTVSGGVGLDGSIYCEVINHQVQQNRSDNESDHSNHKVQNTAINNKTSMEGRPGHTVYYKCQKLQVHVFPAAKSTWNTLCLYDPFKKITTMATATPTPKFAASARGVASKWYCFHHCHRVCVKMSQKKYSRYFSKRAGNCPMIFWPPQMNPKYIHNKSLTDKV